MEEVKSSVEWSKPVGDAKYDWNTILDGKTYILRRGEDFKCKVESFRTNVIATSKRRGLKVRTKVTEGGTALIVQAYAKRVTTANEPNKSNDSFYRARQPVGRKSRALGKVDPRQDPLYNRVIEFSTARGVFSCSSIQKAYAIGNIRAQRIRDALIADGVIQKYDESIPGHLMVEKKEDVSVTIPSEVHTDEITTTLMQGYEFGSNL
jgi:hypothetical protein